MIKIDGALLKELGLGALLKPEQALLQRHIYETLEMTVGVKLADRMTNEQLDEFEGYFDKKDDRGAFQWLERNFPDYKQVVDDQFGALKVEIATLRDAILELSTSGPPVPDPGKTTQPAVSGHAT